MGNINKKNIIFKAKDFIGTKEGLVFAVVEEGLEQGRVLCFLRYVQHAASWEKYSTDQANTFLSADFPEYLYYSPIKDIHLHAVPEARVTEHYQPRVRLRELMRSMGEDRVEQDFIRLCGLYQENGLNLDQVGVTGSLLIGAQKEESDIDLVMSGRENFHKARNLTRQLIKANLLRPLTNADWQISFQRRGCALTLDEYIWHESRKYNKALINGRKFDLSLIESKQESQGIEYRKQGKIKLQATVKDATYAYDYPAQFVIDHPVISSCVSYTATYTGQAKTGEKIDISGSLEISDKGRQRIIIGSSREAEDEYIKVIPGHG